MERGDDAHPTKERKPFLFSRFSTYVSNNVTPIPNYAVHATNYNYAEGFKLINKEISIIGRTASQRKVAAPQTACLQTHRASARQPTIARAVRRTAGVAIAAAVYVTEANGAGVDSVELGTASAPGDAAAAIGAQAIASGNSSLAIGSQANAQNDCALAVGAGATAQGDSAVAMGLSSSAQGEGASAFGPYANAQAERATAVGLNTSALGLDSVAVPDQRRRGRCAH
ncbi:hypothetical protein [Paraburkholderia sp. BR14320]|uniref:hypothetical protein n=1 Tax=unclassified Paraburkholderia TaxID=2615204 RepID=UPI0034CD3669